MAVVVPMESSPEVMNEYLSKLGVSDNWRMVDVLGLDKDALSILPKPVLALILLFPLSEAYEKHRTEEEQQLKAKAEQSSKDIFHLKQVLSNVCGTVALVHSVANNTHQIQLQDGVLKDYINGAKDLDAAGRGALLEKFTGILDAAREVAGNGSGKSGEITEVPNNHFVTFIHKNGTLFELDGRKTFPVDHGPTTGETFLEDAAKICQKFIEREPDNLGFNVVALVAASAE